VTLNPSGPSQVTLDFTRLKDPAKSRRVVISAAAFDPVVMGDVI
jgi:hypothetical protein